MGVSGCGKSLCAKAVARTWEVPLFRLDMNLVYSGLYGNPEATFHEALRTVESAAPVVLWIDEIENGLGTGAQQDQAANHVLSAFLTWMQEKPPLVFVAATANRIEALPAEMIRKGRFDQVFFCDLPNAEERAQIFAIHIRRNRGEPERFDLMRLASQSKEWNAAEIEQAVIAARIDAAAERRDFDTEDVLVHCRTVVPLSRTMREQIKLIRDWAWDRATPASGSEEIRLDEA
jgi:SpoVK/Ycf46/Vps4 family AAA+-type ATPase